MEDEFVDLAKTVEGEASLEKSFCALIELSRCPLCRKLLKEATTVNLCAHTFCQKCIYGKVKETNCCPKCNQELDSTPAVHLLPDAYKNSLAQKVRDYFKREKSANSLSDGTSSNPDEDDVNPTGKLVINPDDAGVVSEGTVEVSSKNIAVLNKEEDDESDRLSSQESSTFPIATQEKKKLVEMPKIAGAASSEDVSEAGKVINVNDKKKRNKKKKARKFTPEKSGNNVEEKASEVIPEGEKERVDAVEKKNEAPAPSKPSEQQEWKKVNAIWFSLVPEKNEDGHAFPPLERSNIRVKNSEMMKVCTIQKYLKQKLNLTAETEVDVLCRGHKLDSDQNLQNIEQIWKSGLPGRGKAKAKWKIEEVVIQLGYTKSRDSKAPVET